MPTRKDLAILSQVRQGVEANKGVLENGTGCSDPDVSDGGWVVIAETVVAEDELIRAASDVNTSKEHHPGRNPLL